jgi:D-arabinose 1-dehydrogenase-like Zn-dependent alcohol dehydrogenase
MERPPKASGKKVIAGVTAMKVDDLQLLARLAESGELRPVIDRTYPLASAAEAHAYVDTGRKRGSVVLSLRPVQERANVVDPAHQTAITAAGS